MPGVNFRHRRDFDRTAVAVRKVEELYLSPQSVNTLQAGNHRGGGVFVRVTSGTPDSDGYYPAVYCHRNLQTPGWYDATPAGSTAAYQCVAVDVGGAGLSDGRVYPGTVVGMVSSNDEESPAESEGKFLVVVGTFEEAAPGTDAAAACDAWTGLSTTLSCPTWETKGTPSGLCSDVPQQSGTFTYSSADSGSTPTWTSRTKELDDAEYEPSFVTTRKLDGSGDPVDPEERTTLGDLFLTVRGGRAMEYRYWTAAEWAARSVGDPYAHTYPMTYDGCVDGELSFIGGSSELCEGTTPTTCSNDTFVVGVRCAACEQVTVCGCVLPKAFCVAPTYTGDPPNCGPYTPVVARYLGTDPDGIARYTAGTALTAGFPPVGRYPVQFSVGCSIGGLPTPDPGNVWARLDSICVAATPSSVSISDKDPDTLEWVQVACADLQAGLTLDLFKYNTVVDNTPGPRPSIGTVVIAPYDPDDEESPCAGAGGDGTDCDEAITLACGSSATLTVPSGATRWLAVAVGADEDLHLSFSGGTGTLTVYGGTCEALGTSLGSTDGSGPLELSQPGAGTYLLELVNSGSGDEFVVEAACPIPVTYDCVSEECVERLDGSGEYTGETALADCQAACVPPAVTYNCVDGGCIDPGDGSGTYTGESALSNCLAACPCDAEWFCVEFTGEPPVGLSNPFCTTRTNLYSDDVPGARCADSGSIAYYYDGITFYPVTAQSGPHADEGTCEADCAGGGCDCAGALSGDVYCQVSGGDNSGTHGPGAGSAEAGWTFDVNAGAATVTVACVDGVWVASVGGNDYPQTDSDCEDPFEVIMFGFIPEVGGTFSIKTEV